MTISQEIDRYLVSLGDVGATEWWRLLVVARRELQRAELIEQQELKARITKAHNHLMNLQPHIAQLPKRDQPFIDSHVDMAIQALEGK